MCLPQVIKSFQNYRGVATTLYPTLVFMQSFFSAPWTHFFLCIHKFSRNSKSIFEKDQPYNTHNGLERISNFTTYVITARKRRNGNDSCWLVVCWQASRLAVQSVRQLLTSHFVYLYEYWQERWEKCNENYIRTKICPENRTAQSWNQVCLHTI